MREEELLDLFRRTETLLEGHFAIDATLHTNRIIHVGKALQFAPFNRKLAYEIVRHFLELDIHVILAPSVSAIPLAVEIGRQLEARAIFLDPLSPQPTLSQGFMMHAGERVVIVQDLLLNDNELDGAITLIRQAEARLIGVGSVIDTRTSRRTFTVKDVTAIKLSYEHYPVSDCPLCAKGLPLSSE
jgi:orotate phosphoribosyltransferase